MARTSNSTPCRAAPASQGVADQRVEQIVGEGREVAAVRQIARVDPHLATAQPGDRGRGHGDGGRRGGAVGASDAPADDHDERKAVLAALPPEEVAALYGGSDDVGLPRLRRELALVRKRGFAINDQRTETGLTALATAIRDASGAPVAAAAIAMPTARFHRDHVSSWVAALNRAVSRVERELRSAA